MHTSRLMVLCCVVALLAVSTATAQPQPPKPGPEHERLKQLEGTWEATIKSDAGESKGTMTYKTDVKGMWLVGDFQGEFGGEKFQGKALDGYDVRKKQYVSVWVDSWSATPMLSTGSFDKDGKVLTMTGEGTGMDGKPTKFKSVTQLKDKDTMKFTMYMLDKDNKEQVMMTINYKRKK